MKKYLMMGVSALAMGAMFTSCGNDEVSVADYYKAVYEQKFVEVFGQPSANQEWGFSASGSTRATRSNPGDTYPATHTYADGGANANANEWADPNKEFGGWVVPDPLTEGQKLRVKMYFQANPNLSYVDPHFRHFFVQQVYKGNTSVGPNSTEVVTAADGSKYDSDNMNHLTVGQSNMHINNFNTGTCSMNNTVLDNGGNVNDGPYHSDQIMLMVNIDDTSCFGYHDSGSSNEETVNHNDKAALVSAAVIDAWAAQNGNPGEAVVDKWNRSFMGFDLAIKEGKQVYATDAAGNVQYASYNQAAEGTKYAWDGEKIIEIAEQSAETGWQFVYKEGYETIMNVGWLTTNKNFYIAADQIVMPQTLSMNRMQASEISGIQNAPLLKDVMDGDTYYQSVINLPRIKQLVDDGYLPVNNKSLAEWVKVGVSDGYFSDWIVTLTEATRSGGIIPGGPTKKSIRIMAEDVSASEASDFDFNDVVFDVEAEFPEGTESVNQVKVTVWAAGGTLPLRINSVDGNGGFEVHNAMGITYIKTMINTHAESYAGTFDGITYEWIDNVPEYSTTITLANGAEISKDAFEADVNEYLRVEVEKTEGEWILLTSLRGRPACKIGCPVGTPWALEKHNMNNAFTSFKAWVNNGTPANWYSSKVNAQIYNAGMSVIYGKFD